MESITFVTIHFRLFYLYIKSYIMERNRFDFHQSGFVPDIHRHEMRIFPNSMCQCKCVNVRLSHMNFTKDAETSERRSFWIIKYTFYSFGYVLAKNFRLAWSYILVDIDLNLFNFDSTKTIIVFTFLRSLFTLDLSRLSFGHSRYFGDVVNTMVTDDSKKLNLLF